MASWQVPLRAHTASGKTHSWPRPQSRAVVQPATPASTGGSLGQRTAVGMHARRASQQRVPAAQRTVAQKEVAGHSPREATRTPAARGLHALP
jgi:hypothetical protein